jgi:hypothetical protein
VRKQSIPCKQKVSIPSCSSKLKEIDNNMDTSQIFTPLSSPVLYYHSSSLFEKQFSLLQNYFTYCSPHYVQNNRFCMHATFGNVFIIFLVFLRKISLDRRKREDEARKPLGLERNLLSLRM